MFVVYNVNTCKYLHSVMQEKNPWRNKTLDGKWTDNIHRAKRFANISEALDTTDKITFLSSGYVRVRNYAEWSAGVP